MIEVAIGDIAIRPRADVDEVCLRRHFGRPPRRATSGVKDFLVSPPVDSKYPSEQGRKILSAARGNVGSWRSMRTRSTMRFWRCYG